MGEWIEVSDKEFFAVIGPQDVHPSIQPGPWPYTSVWKGRYSGTEVGRSEDYLPEGQGTTSTRYYLQQTKTG